MTDRVLLVLTSHDRLGDTGRGTGFYVPEAAHPWRVFADAGYQVDLVTVQGGRPPMDGLDAADPVQQAFLSDPRISDQLAATRRPDQVAAADYRAIFYVGGHGAMWDLPHDPALAALARDIYQAGGVVAAVCHGPAGLVDLTLSSGQYIVDGRNVAAFSNDEERAVGLTEVVPFLLADRLVERGARYSNAGNFQPHVVVDGRLVTGQNPASATGVAEAVVRTLGTAVTSGWVTIGGTLDGYLARPTAPGRYPGVVIGFQLFGLDAHVRALADRVAGLGYVAVVPDLYHRTAPRAELPMDAEGRRRGFELLRQLTRDGVLDDVASTMEYLRMAAGAGPRIGMVGLSMGGHIGYLAATQLDLAATAVLFPGWLTTTELGIGQPVSTVELTPGVAERGGRLLFLVGDEDHVVGEADRKQVAEALTAAGVRHEMVVYPGTPHAFFFEGTETYRPEPAADAWQRIRDLLATELSS
jgi:dienelactone hydrolase/putative intracellular protease/amidase